MDNLGATIASVVLGLTIACIVAGLLLGLMRGRNRSILRMVLVAGCAVLAFIAKDPIIETAMKIEIQGQTLEQMFLGAMGTEIPQFAVILITSLLKVILGLVIFLVLFILLQVVTWLILFPILKIFIRKGAKKSALVGGIVGVVQGVLVAFIICAPITGAVTQVDKISKMTINGQTVAETANIPDMSDYMESPAYGIYNSAGKWFFDAITTYKDQNGNNVTLDDTVQAAETGTKVLEEVNKIQETLNQIGKETEGGEAKSDADSLRDIAGSLSNMDEIINNTSDGGKQVMNTLIEGLKDMLTENENNGETEGGEGAEGESGKTDDKISEIISNIKVEELKLDSAAGAMEGIADFVDYNEGKIEEIPEDTATKIVEGLADNAFVLEVLGDEKMVDIGEENHKEFTNAINNADVDQATKDKIAMLLGITLNQQP